MLEEITEHQDIHLVKMLVLIVEMVQVVLLHKVQVVVVMVQEVVDQEL